MSQSLNQSVDGQPIELADAATPLHQSKLGAVSKVVLVVSNTDAAARVISFDIGGSKLMEHTIAANTIVELPEILVQNGAMLSAFGSVAAVVRVLGRVEVTG